MYPPQVVAPMKAELVNVGFQDLTTAEEVDNFMKIPKALLWWLLIRFAVVQLVRHVRV